MTLDYSMKWVSKYGSITFTQVGKELPIGGMNKIRFTIEFLWLDDTTYPLQDFCSTVYEF